MEVRSTDAGSNHRSCHIVSIILLRAGADGHFMEMFLIVAPFKGVGVLFLIAYVFYVCRNSVPNLPIAGLIVLHILRLSANNALECPDSHLAKLRRFV